MHEALEKPKSNCGLCLYVDEYGDIHYHPARGIILLIACSLGHKA